ncbi:MAG: hypothetical protein Q8P05_03720 [Candidatus Diapherotrites archaeon]|nr:hypothetical protein [Candidatus Diapherotrites archaeon]MDZ4256984.1 hypothetical protein [archaeon]
MTYHALLILFLAWTMGVFLGTQVVTYSLDPPTLLAILGLILVSAGLGTLFFGIMGWLFLFLLGMLLSPLVSVFPISGNLLGVSLVAAILFGKTLGGFALEDIYENGQVRLPNYAIAAGYDVVYVLAFGLLVWALWHAFPDMETLRRILPLAGLGV